jgi:hypothetical protein
LRSSGFDCGHESSDLNSSFNDGIRDGELLLKSSSHVRMRFRSEIAELVQSGSQLRSDEIGQLAGSSRRVNAFSPRGLVQRKTGAVPEKLIILEIAVSLAMGTGEDTVGERGHFFQLTRTWTMAIDPSQTSDSMGHSRS